VDVKIDDLEVFDTQKQREMTFADREYTIRINGLAPASGMSFAFVRANTLQPPRLFLARPPEQPPASLAP
jgi:hypothetical protein